MDVHADMRRHEAALLRAVQKPPAKPWRGAGTPPPPPPKVYHVEPREFRDLVQRLTGASATPTTAVSHHHHQTTMTPPTVPVRAASEDNQLYAPWFSAFQMDAHHGNGALM